MKRLLINAGFIIQLLVIVLLMGTGVVLLVYGFIVNFMRGAFPVEAVVGIVCLGIGVTCCILGRIAARGG